MAFQSPTHSETRELWVPDSDGPCVALLIVRADLDRTRTRRKIVRQTESDLRESEARHDTYVFSSDIMRLTAAVNQINSHRGSNIVRR